MSRSIGDWRAMETTRQRAQTRSDKRCEWSTSSLVQYSVRRHFQVVKSFPFIRDVNYEKDWPVSVMSQRYITYVRQSGTLSPTVGMVDDAAVLTPEGMSLLLGFSKKGSILTSPS